MSKNKSKLLKRNKFRIYSKIIIWSLFSFSVVYGFLFWINNNSLKVDTVEIIGNKFVDTSDIVKIFEEESAGKHLFLVSRKNFLFVPKDKIEDRIKSILSVEDVYVEIDGIHNVEIEVSEYKPTALYCFKEECFFVNKNGLIFIKTPDFYVNDLIVLEGQIFESKTEDSDDTEDEEVNPQILGFQYTDQDVFQKLIKTSELLMQDKIKISKITTEDFETYSLETVPGTKILIEKRDDPEIIVSNLKATLAQESIHEIQFNNIDYFDLRFEDKVFYKLK